MNEIRHYQTRSGAFPGGSYSMVKQMKISTIFLLAILIGCLSGCTSVKMASPELDKIAKEFAPPADKSYIYVMRRWAFTGDAIFTLVHPLQ